MDRNSLIRKSKNPFYKMSDKERIALELTTQEIRTNDKIVNITPQVRRKKRETSEVRRNKMSEENMGQEVSDISSLPELDSEG